MHATDHKKCKVSEEIEAKETLLLQCPLENAHKNIQDERKISAGPDISDKNWTYAKILCQDPQEKSLLIRRMTGK